MAGETSEQKQAAAEAKAKAKADAEAKALADAQAAAGRSPALRITARIAGFRRAGVGHPAAPVDHEVGRFSADELAALRAEPALVVEET